MGSLTAAGASGGIGEACAWRFAEAGCKLVLLARRTEKLTELQTKLQEEYRVRNSCFSSPMHSRPHGCTTKFGVAVFTSRAIVIPLSQRAQPEQCAAQAMLLWSLAGAHPHSHAGREGPGQHRSTAIAASRRVRRGEPAIVCADELQRNTDASHTTLDRSLLTTGGHLGEQCGTGSWCGTCHGDKEGGVPLQSTNAAAAPFTLHNA